mmetsp:Transcript_89971/g.178823  ORF Transcript_89971/g.178823 Transcript_89971/m.178823 type:complete len:299 (+) Transcript_89971:839-1735(+)
MGLWLSLEPLQGSLSLGPQVLRLSLAHQQVVLVVAKGKQLLVTFGGFALPQQGDVHGQPAGEGQTGIRPKHHAQGRGPARRRPTPRALMTGVGGLPVTETVTRTGRNPRAPVIVTGTGSGTAKGSVIMTVNAGRKFQFLAIEGELRQSQKRRGEVLLVPTTERDGHALGSGIARGPVLGRRRQSHAHGMAKGDRRQEISEGTRNLVRKAGKGLRPKESQQKVERKRTDHHRIGGGRSPGVTALLSRRQGTGKGMLRSLLHRSLRALRRGLPTSIENSQNVGLLRGSQSMGSVQSENHL